MVRILIILFLIFSFSSSKAQLSDLISLDPNSVSKGQVLQMGALTGFQQATGSDQTKMLPLVVDTISSMEDTLLKAQPEEPDSVLLEKERQKRFRQVYGKSFFEQKNLKIFRSASHVKAPDDYVLGAGDELNIAVWGYSDVSEALRVGDDGAVHAKLIGKIYLNGLTLGEARKLISSKYGTVYDLRNSQISIQLNYAKVIMVNIVGEVNNPGTYSVSSLNSAFNVLSIAGGIGRFGSVRNIVIKRDNKVIKVLDVYKFLSDPSTANDFFLKNNDYIIVQPALKVVEIKGGVARDGKYELTEKEGIAELIKYAGGLSYNAFTKTVLVTTIEKDLLVAKDVNLQDEMGGKKKYMIKNGDVFQVNTISANLRNFVVVKGSVQVAGNFEYIKGEKVLGLLKRAHGLKYDAYLGRAYVLRTTPDGVRQYFKVNIENILKDSTHQQNIELKEFDEFQVFSVNDFKDEFFIEIEGAVRHKARVVYTENLTLQDMVFYAGGLRNEAANKRIEIARFINYNENNEGNEPIKVIVETYELGNNLDLTSLQEVKLRPFDKIFVRQVTDFQDQRYVTLSGEFKYPGTYALLHSKETIKEVIERAGGFTDGAFLEGASMSRSLDDKGKLVIDLKALYDRGEDQYNYVMRTGDSLIVPKTDDVISIRGEVGTDVILDYDNQNAPFTRGKRANFYVKEYAGGFTKESNRNAVYVISASGKMKKSTNYFLFRKYPKVHKGDRIFVDKKPPKGPEAEKVDWGKVIGDITAKATGVLTLIILFNKVF